MIKRGVIGLGAAGKLTLKLPDGSERPIEPPARVRSVAFLVMDCSGSMAGDKLAQAKRGAEDFARSALRGGYLIGVVAFGDDAHIATGPEATEVILHSALASLTAGGGTNLTAGLTLAASNLEDRRTQRAIVVVTDGQPNDRESALVVARAASQAGIRIIAIGTDDADAAFLASLSTAPDLAAFVDASNLREGVATAARLLLPGKRSP